MVATIGNSHELYKALRDELTNVENQRDALAHNYSLLQARFDTLVEKNEATQPQPQPDSPLERQSTYWMITPTYLHLLECCTEEDAEHNGMDLGAYGPYGTFDSAEAARDALVADLHHDLKNAQHGSGVLEATVKHLEVELDRARTALKAAGFTGDDIAGGIAHLFDMLVDERGYNDRMSKANAELTSANQILTAARDQLHTDSCKTFEDYQAALADLKITEKIADQGRKQVRELKAENKRLTLVNTRQSDLLKQVTGQARLDLITPVLPGSTVDLPLTVKPAVKAAQPQTEPASDQPSSDPLPSESADVAQSGAQ